MQIGDLYNVSISQMVENAIIRINFVGLIPEDHTCWTRAGLELKISPGIFGRGGGASGGGGGGIVCASAHAFADHWKKSRMPDGQSGPVLNPEYTFFTLNVFLLKAFAKHAKGTFSMDFFSLFRNVAKWIYDLKLLWCSLEFHEKYHSLR